MYERHYQYCKLRGMRWCTRRPKDKDGVLVTTDEKNDNTHHRSLKHNGFDVNSLQKEKKES